MQQKWITTSLKAVGRPGMRAGLPDRMGVLLRRRAATGKPRLTCRPAAGLHRFLSPQPGAVDAAHMSPKPRQKKFRQACVWRFISGGTGQETPSGSTRLPLQRYRTPKRPSNEYIESEED